MVHIHTYIRTYILHTYIHAYKQNNYTHKNRIKSIKKGRMVAKQDMEGKQLLPWFLPRLLSVMDPFFSKLVLVLTSFMSAYHKLAVSERKEPQLRKCFNKIHCKAFS